jgi:hypothetical protein
VGDFFQEKSVTGDDIATERVEQFETLEDIEFYYEAQEQDEEVIEFKEIQELIDVDVLEDHLVEEIVMEPQYVKKKVPQRATVYQDEEKTRTEQRPVEVHQPGGCFRRSRSWIEYVNVSVKYTETVPYIVDAQVEVIDVVQVAT